MDSRAERWTDGRETDGRQTGKETERLQDNDIPPGGELQAGRQQTEDGRMVANEADRHHRTDRHLEEGVLEVCSVFVVT
jgi:hypothetical protein